MKLPGYEQLLDGIDPSLRTAILKIHAVFGRADYECYLVGGLVRDLMMGRSGGDVDIATNARPERVQRLFQRTIPTGIKHGTITVLMDGVSCEVTTYRADGAYSDGRRPDSVAYADSLGDDLARRDFTINALAFEPGRGLLVDDFDGIADLRARRIRTIGDPRQRFFEDGLRPVRACRFAATLEFDPVPETLDAIRDPEVQARTRMVAVERFADELWKGMKSTRPDRMVRLLEATGILELFAFADFAASGPAGGRAPADDSLESLGSFGDCAPSFRMAWWWRAAGIARAAFEDLGRALKFSGKQIRDIQRYFDYIEFQIGAGAPAGDDAFRVRRLLAVMKNDYRKEAPAFLEAAPDLPGQAHDRAELLEILARDPLVIGDLAVGGQELQALGLRGPAIGRALQALLELVWHDPAANERAGLLAAARDFGDEV